MTKTILFILALILLTATHARAGFGLPDAKWEPINELILSETLATRCQLLYFKIGPQCEAASYALVQAMDQKRESKEGTFVAFYSDFVKMSKSKWISSYLKYLEDKATDLLSSGESYSLYDITVEWVKKYQKQIRDPDFQAAYLIAVLFQDNISVLHLRYFEVAEKNVVPAEVLEALYRIHNNLLPSQMFQPDPKTFEGYFPPQMRKLAKNFNQGFYYFYMPWLFMEKLRASVGGQSWLIDGLDRELPLLLSTLYKYKYLYEGSYAKALLYPMVATSKLNKKGELVPVDQNWIWRYRDLYAAYLSTHVWRSHPRVTYSYKAFTQGIATQPGPTLLGIKFSQ